MNEQQYECAQCHGKYPSQEALDHHMQEHGNPGQAQQQQSDTRQQDNAGRSEQAGQPGGQR